MDLFKRAIFCGNNFQNNRRLEKNFQKIIVAKFKTIIDLSLATIWSWVVISSRKNCVVQLYILH